MFTYLLTQGFSLSCLTYLHVLVYSLTTDPTLCLYFPQALVIFEETYLYSGLDDVAAPAFYGNKQLAGSRLLSVQHCRASHFWEEAAATQREVGAGWEGWGWTGGRWFVFLLCSVSDEGYWAGKRTDWGQSSVSVIVFTSRVWWPCVFCFLSLSLCPPLSHFQNSLGLICPSHHCVVFLSCSSTVKAALLNHTWLPHAQPVKCSSLWLYLVTETMCNIGYWEKCLPRVNVKPPLPPLPPKPRNFLHCHNKITKVQLLTVSTCGPTKGNSQNKLSAGSQLASQGASVEPCEV